MNCDCNIYNFTDQKFFDKREEGESKFREQSKNI